jgi:dienelactone hydrolase
MVRSVGAVAMAAVALFAVEANAQSDVARNFGARESVQQISLSPEGKRVAFVAPGPGQSAVLFIANVGGGEAKRILHSDGKPERIRACHWTSETRLVCQIHMLIDDVGKLVSYTRMVSLDVDTKEIQILSARASIDAHRTVQFGGSILDWLPGEQNAVLMTRHFVPDSKTGSRIGSDGDGMGVEWVDTRTLKRKVIERARPLAVEYISDGHGEIRIIGMAERSSGQYATGVINYFYRLPGQNDLKPLSKLEDGRGFNPYAVDKDLNLAYGFERKDGRMALYRVALDGTGKKELVHERPDVDLDGLIRVGRRQRVVGVTFATEKREAHFFDPKLRAMAATLSKALPGLPLISFVDASADENRLLFWAGSDTDPGRYYVFDRTARQLNEILLARPQLEKTVLAKVTPVTFPAADGTRIPGYLTLPPGSSGKGLPAIVMPHGGPGSRDEWGFDWLAQYYAARGFAVLQPNFRGSTGYGDAWFQKNGFQSWRLAVGDVNDGGRWLVSQGIAAADKLAIVGWSYGGYAALQSSVLDADLFKAIVAVAPVTDLQMLRAEARGFTNFQLVSDFIGSGPHLREGSPLRNAARIKAPVLMFHGDMDSNVGVGESRAMASALKEAGKSAELVEFPGLDHQLDDSAARTNMLEKSDTFLKAALKM